jgi:hypothetical protein
MHLNINVDCRMQTQPPLSPFAGGGGQEIRVILNISQKPGETHRQKLTGEKVFEILQQCVVSELIKNNRKIIV